MKLTAEKFKEKKLKELSNVLGWSGSGISDDPIIIDSTKGLPSEFIIVRSNLHIVLKDLKLNYISLIRAQNIIIENCTGDIYTYHCHDLVIDKCKLSRFTLNYSFNNTIKNTSIDYVDNHFSRGNQFQNNKIPPQFIKGITEGTYKELYTSTFKFLPLILLFLISYLLTSNFIAENPNLRFMLIIGIVFLAIVEMYLLVPHYRTMKKLKAYPANQIN